MSNFIYSDPIITKRRKGTPDDPFVDISESHQVENSKVVLSEIPDKFTKVRVTGAGVTWIEKTNGMPAENEYVVDYSNNIVTFHSSRNGLQLQFEYKGTGMHYVPASMIYTKVNGGEIEETLDQLLTAADNFTHMGKWNSNTEYKNRNIVEYGTGTYMAIKDVPAGIPPTDQNYWKKITGFNYRGVYDTNTSYQLGDFVIDANNENIYMSLSDNNSNKPLTDANYWEKMISVTDAINAVNVAIDNAETATMNANTAATNANNAADNANQAADNANNTNIAISTAEAERVAAENDRVNAENIREQQESQRQANEVARIANEDTREQQETQRQINESNRELAEETRINAENTREAQEAQRQVNENNRELAEDARVDAENIREQNEAQRQANETTRIANENIREQQEAQRQANTATAIENAEIATANAQNLVNSSVHLGEYNPSTQYVKNNHVRYQGSTWRCLKDCIGVTPTEGEFWTLVAQRGLDGTGSVVSVNGKLPDVNGNVTLTATDVGAETPSGAQNKADQAEQNAKDYTDQQIANIDFPVDSVNGKTGAVTLMAADVGAETPEGSQQKANQAEANAKAYTDQQIQLISETGIPKLVSYTYTLTATEDNQTVFTIPLDTFDVNTDTISVYQNRTYLEPTAYTVTNTVFEPEIVHGYITLNEGVKAGTEIVIFILKNVPIGEEGSINGAVLGVNSVPQDRVIGLESDLSNLQTSVQNAQQTANSHASRHAVGGEDPITPEMIGAETPAGAQAKANTAETNAKAYAQNAVAIGSNADPNTTQESYILTNHANSPGGGVYWHIQTFFYSNKTGNRAQIAFQYNGSGHKVYTRHYYGSTWSPWVLMVDEMGFDGLKQSVSDGKAQLETAIIDKGGTVSKQGNVATFQELDNGIRSIPTEATVQFQNYHNGTAFYNLKATMVNERANLAGASVGNYALFAGGNRVSSSGSASSYNAVEAYDTALTRTTATTLSTFRMSLAGASVGNYALFAGGYQYDEIYRNTVDAYDTSLVRTTATNLSQGRSNLAGASVGNYALFAGGYSGSTAVNTVDAYNTALTRTTPTALSVARSDFAGVSVGNYALFAGGGGTVASTVYNTVDAYNTSLTRTTPTALSAARRGLAGASVGNYALFAGGYSGGTSYQNTVDAYNTSLTRTTPTALSAARRGLAGASVNDIALFAGGSNGNYLDTVDAYNTSLSRITPYTVSLSAARSELAGASVGNYALFAGGYSGGSNYHNTVDAFQVTPVAHIPVTAGSKYKFTEANEQTASVSTTLVYTQRVTGYVKYKGGTIVT